MVTTAHRTAATLTAVLLAAAAAPLAPAAAATTVRPGSTIKQTAGDKVSTCTVAAVGRSGKQRIALTAGHCKISDGKVTDANNTALGTYRAAVAENKDRIDTDASGYGIITLDDAIATTSATTSGNLTGYRAAATGDQVCLLGATSGRACGAVTSTNDKSISVSVVAKPGDSGGPLIQYLDGPKDSSGHYVNFAIVGIVVGVHGLSTTVANPIGNVFAGVSSVLGPNWTYTTTAT